MTQTALHKAYHTLPCHSHQLEDIKPGLHYGWWSWSKLGEPGRYFEAAETSVLLVSLPCSLLSWIPDLFLGRFLGLWICWKLGQTHIQLHKVSWNGTWPNKIPRIHLFVHLPPSSYACSHYSPATRESVHLPHLLLLLPGGLGWIPGQLLWSDRPFSGLVWSCYISISPTQCDQGDVLPLRCNNAGHQAFAGDFPRSTDENTCQ